MSYYSCPNFAICNERIYIRNSTSFESFCSEVKLKFTPVYNSKTKTYDLSIDNCKLPVCWYCKFSYNDKDDIETNKYLSFDDSIECCICLNKDSGVSFPNCQHFTCIPCHIRCWFGSKLEEIDFPYPLEIEKLYNLDSENEIWKNDLKIVEYLKLKSEVDGNRISQWYAESNLRKCPVCRC